MSKTCFVVSPIGEKGSDTRKRADDLFELVIEPALEKFSFDVIRADKIIGSNEITGDVVNLIQTADLCVIDLTGENPNVFYECGRRHEAGKPFIQLITDGERIPFDLAGIRTIPYNTSDARTVRDVSAQIRDYVEQFERDGYGAESGTSLASVAQWVQRIERKLDRVLVGGSNDLSPSGTTTQSGIETLLRSPREGFMEAIANSRPDIAANYLPAYKQRYGIGEEFIGAAALLAAAGVQSAASELTAVLLDEDTVSSLNPDAIETAAGGYGQYYAAVDQEEYALEEMGGTFQRLAENTEYGVDVRAAVFNRLAMLCYGAGVLDDAERFQLRAIEFSPKPSYLHNMSLVLEKAERLEEAEKYVDQFMQSAASRSNGDHIGQAIDIYLARGRTDEARRLFSLLSEVAPGKARTKRTFDEKLKVILDEDGS